jgi:hypothetical protein
MTFLVKTILRAEEPPSTRFSPKTACSMSQTVSTPDAARFDRVAGKVKATHGLSTYSSFASCAGWRCELVRQNLMWNFSLMQVAVQRCTLIGMTFFSLSPELTLVWSRATYSAFAASALSGSTRMTSRSSAIPSCHRPSRHSASA